MGDAETSGLALPSGNLQSNEDLPPAAGTEPEGAGGGVRGGGREGRGDYTQLFQNGEREEARRNEATEAPRAGWGGKPTAVVVGLAANRPLQQTESLSATQLECRCMISVTETSTFWTQAILPP
ncbi:hypothetical protein AAY473_030870 [Plecturocebus cupreus]